MLHKLRRLQMSKIYLIFILLSILQLAPCSLQPVACASSLNLEETPFTYESRGRRDPFIPLITKEGRVLTSYAKIASINDIVIEGILYDPRGGSVVIMNDFILKKGDNISDIIIESIEKHSVTLSFKGQEHTFNLKEEMDE